MLLGEDYSLDNLQWHASGDLATELCENASRPGKVNESFDEVLSLLFIASVGIEYLPCQATS